MLPIIRKHLVAPHCTGVRFPNRETKNGASMPNPKTANESLEGGQKHLDPDLSYLESTLGYRMKRALVELYRGIYDSLGDNPLTLVQFSVLSIAQDNPGIAQSELAKALGVERPRLVPLIDRLEKLGLAERRQNPEDRRGRMIFLTPDGETRINELKQSFDAHQSKLISELGTEKFHILMESLEWIVQTSTKRL